MGTATRITDHIDDCQKQKTPRALRYAGFWTFSELLLTYRDVLLGGGGSNSRPSHCESEGLCLNLKGY